MYPRIAIGLARTAFLIAAWAFMAYETAAAAPDEGASLETLLATCAQCHGPEFGGRQQRMAPRLAGLESWYLERQLRNFRDGIRGAHPDDGYGMQMNFVAGMFGSEDEIRHFAEFVSAAQPGTVPATVEGDISDGKQLYATCAGCHGHRGEGSEAENSPRLADQSDWYLVAQLRNFNTGRRGAHSGDSNGKVMAAAALSLTDDQMIYDLVAYINTLD